MKARNRNKARKFPLTTIVVLGGLVLTAIVLAQNSRKVNAGPGIHVNANEHAKASDAPDVSVTVDKSERKPLNFYTGGIRGDLFTPPLPPKPVVKTEVKAVLPPAPPVIPNPFADYAYTGTVTIGNQMLAMVENSKTKEGQYLKQGDTFLGGTVAQVDDRMVTVTVGAKQEKLAKSDDFKLVSLDKNAGFLQPQAAQPGTPGAPGAAPAGPPGGFQGMGGGANPWMQRMQERFQNMSPEDRQRMQERMMNRQFERGSGRGGFGGGRGNRGGGGGGGMDMLF